MSLINDALKRATEAQNKADQTPPPDLKFRSVDPKEPAPKNFGWLMPSIITAVVLVGIFVVWQMAGKKQEAKSPPAGANAAAQAASSSGLKVHAREQETPGTAISGSKMPDLSEREKVAVVAVSGTTIQETTRNHGTNSAAAPDSKPAGPKLQAIVYNPASPSAMISGNTVFVGEKAGEWKVVAISKDSATLVCGGETKVLKLGQ